MILIILFYSNILSEFWVWLVSPNTLGTAWLSQTYLRMIIKFFCFGLAAIFCYVFKALKRVAKAKDPALHHVLLSIRLLVFVRLASGILRCGILRNLFRLWKGIATVELKGLLYYLVLIYFFIFYLYSFHLGVFCDG